MSIVVVIAGVWLVTQLLEMMPVTDLVSPVPALVMVLSAALVATAAMKIHSQMDRTFRRTLLGDVPSSNATKLDDSTSAGD